MGTLNDSLDLFSWLGAIQRQTIADLQINERVFQIE